MRRGKKASVAMVGESGDPGASNGATGLPFDPVLGAKIFGEIQAEGLRAAGALVDRLVHLVDGPRANPAESTTETPAGSGPASINMGAVLPWFELWRDLIERTSETLQRIQGASTGPAGSGVQVGIDGSLVPAEPLVVRVDAGHGQGEMWLHNGTPADQGELVPSCGQLSDAHGNALACDVSIDPPKIDGLPSRSSRGFVISVATSEATPEPGTYRGVVQVRGADAVWMPIEVVVSATAP